MEALTLIEEFYKKEQETPNAPFLRQPFGDRWEVYTYGEAGQMARKLATALKAMGIKPKSHVGLVSKNCREWIIADLAILMAECVSVPFYPTLTSDQIKEVIELGDVDALFVGKMEVWDEMKLGVPEEMPKIAFPHYEGNSKVTNAVQWEDALAKYEPMEGCPSPALDDLWTIVFTSGTTGTPKGVMLSFRTVQEVGSIRESYNPLHISMEGDNHFFSFLPLNHIAERVIVEGGCVSNGGQISFTESLARFGQNLSDTQPTVFFAVPRIWTKLQLGILAKMPQKRLDTLLKIPIISGMVKKKIKAGLGFSKCRAFVSGAAPISQAAKDWFAKVDIPISEGYGMTENCAVCTFLEPKENKPRSVGKAQPKSELRIDEESGEILMRAPYVMLGYYNNPEKTAEVIKDGWLHTGDQGKIDEDGYLYITGRVKDTFKTSKGKYIVPAPLEREFEGNNDVEQICVVGLGCPQPVALVVPSEVGMSKDKKELEDSLCESLQRTNSELPNYRRISTVVVMNEPWGVENGLLTPTLKVKRNVMNNRFRDHFTNWHERPEQVIWE